MDFWLNIFFNFFFSIFLYQNALKLILGINFNYFYHISPINQLKWPYLAFFDHLVIFAKKKSQFRENSDLTENAF